MTLRKKLSSEAASIRVRVVPALGLISLALILIFAGAMACRSSSQEAVEEEQGTVLKEGINEFEGVVKLGVGRFMFVPAFKGFDIVVFGDLSTGDTSSLEGKEVRGEGWITLEKPSILVASRIEVKDESGSWNVVYETQEQQEFEEFLDLKAREEFKALSDVNYRQKEDWEEAERVKVYGNLDEEAGRIVLLDDEGREAGKIIVDDVSDYAQYYLKKLRLFDRFWYYLDVKDTVEWSTRRRTRELFHADVVFAGLF